MLVAKWICSDGKLLGADLLGLPDGDEDALEEAKGDWGLMRYGGFGCLERQSGRAADGLLGLPDGDVDFLEETRKTWG